MSRTGGTVCATVTVVLLNPLPSAFGLLALVGSSLVSVGGVSLVGIAVFGSTTATGATSDT